LGGGCGDQKCLGHHNRVVTKTILIAIQIAMIEFRCHKILITKLSHHSIVTNKFDCHQMASYEFSCRQWIKAIFGCHLGWQPNYLLVV
jgi:hypothetical protein